MTKRIIIILLILSIFLSLNTISATEVDLNDTIYKTQLNSVDDEIIEISSSGDCPISVSDS